MRRSKRTSQVLLMVAGLVLALTCLAQAAPPAGLVAYYKLDATSGLTAVDETGAHEGTLTGALAWVEGHDGNGLEFQGGNGSPFVNLGAWQTDGPAGLSLSVWVKWAGVSGAYQGLVSQRDGTMYWWTEMNPEGTQLRFKSNTSPQSNLTINGESLIEGEWTHFACTHDAVAGTAVVYLNGEERVAGGWSLPDGDFSNLRVGIGVVNTGDGLGTFNGVLDEVMIFDVPLSAEDIAGVMQGFSDPTASAPAPAGGSVDVPRDVVLDWQPGPTAAGHDVYFGTSFEDVSAAERGDPRGVLVSQNQTGATFDPDGLLEFSQTYYWRIDEVNAAPDSTIFKGEVWSFTAEPLAYQIADITATASSVHNVDMDPAKTIDGSGLDAGDRHAVTGTDMWLSSGDESLPVWIQYEFDRAYKLHQMRVWNSNQAIETFVGFGAKDVTIEYSADGAEWTVLEGVTEFAQASGSAAYTANTTVDFGGAVARFVKITINDNWGMLGQAGLSEVRFLYTPTVARAPQPADGAIDVGLDAVLDWRGGREAAAHDVYFSTDEQAVVEGAALIDTVSDSSYDLAAAGLEYGQTYYWKINEINDAAVPAVVEGDLWSFSTVRYFVVEDMESYNDDLDGGTAIFQTWIDGWDNGSGATVGYLTAPFAERSVVNSGAQSLPLDYNNVNSPWYSETERTWDSPQNWTVDGATHVMVNFRGNAVGLIETASGNIRMGGAGADIWNTADEFRFAYKRLSGDGSITAKVESLDATNDWAKAGVMIRESLDPGSKHGMVVSTPVSGVSFQRRLLTSDASSATTQAELPTVYWVKLTRTGNTFTAERSEDGVTWSPITDDAAASSIEIEMIGSVYIGLAVTSHVAGTATTAEFSNVATTGSVTGSWQAEAIGVAQPANDAAPLYVAVEDSAGKLKVVNHPDANATVTPTWQEWAIPLSDFTGVNMARVTRMIIGVGDRDNPTPDGSGLLYIDDIRVGRPVE